jgi:hypothetical protein
LATHVRRDAKNPPYKFIKFILQCSFMSLGYELVVFGKFIKFIKFILVSTSCNSETSGAKPQLPQKRRKLGTPAVEQGDLKDDLRPEVTSGGVQIASIISKIFRPICFQKVRSRFTEQQQAHDFAHL